MLKESPAVYAGSADLMPRNFYRRIEALFPVQEPELKTRLIYILKLYLDDNKDAYSLQTNGSYTKLNKAKDAEGLSAQETFMLASQKQKQIKLKARTKDQEATLI